MPLPSLKFSVALCALVLLAPLPVRCETVDANTATEAQLDGLLGLGPATTRLILAERDKARFKNWQDLIARVKGLGPKAAAKLSAAGLNVDGQPYVATVQKEK
jgi:competence protein ComEA